MSLYRKLEQCSDLRERERERERESSRLKVSLAALFSRKLQTILKEVLETTATATAHTFSSNKKKLTHIYARVVLRKPHEWRVAKAINGVYGRGPTRTAISRDNQFQFFKSRPKNSIILFTLERAVLSAACSVTNRAKLPLR